MAITLEFIDFIVPISVIEAKWPGGWRSCIAEHRNLIGRRVWFDDHLFRNGAINWMDISNLREDWAALGFTAIEHVDGKEVWKDICVHDAMRGTIRPCPWLAKIEGLGAAYLMGTNPGEIIDRDNVRVARHGDTGPSNG